MIQLQTYIDDNEQYVVANNREISQNFVVCVYINIYISSYVFKYSNSKKIYVFKFIIKSDLDLDDNEIPMTPILFFLWCALNLSSSFLFPFFFSWTCVFFWIIPTACRLKVKSNHCLFESTLAQSRKNCLSF